MTQMYNKPPQVVVSYPKNYAVDIPTDLSVITVGFNTDLDTNYITGNVRLQSQQGVFIPISVKYEFRQMTIAIQKPLEPNTVYQLMIFGDGNLTDTEVTGIRNVFGIPMQGNVIITFTTAKSTALPAPHLITPGDNTNIASSPTFQWNAVTGASRYEIQVSRSNTFTPVAWASAYISSTSATPSLPLEDGMYYWRVRAWDAAGKPSDWSATFVFNLNTQTYAPVVEEDTLPPELEYDPIPYTDEVEFIDYFPKEDYSNVATNLQTIYFHVLGEVQVNEVSIEMIGESIFGEDNDHGVVTGKLEVLPQGDGTTIIAFTPDVLPSTS